jgi:hypothetical protein
MKNIHLLPTDKPSRLAGSEYITNEQGIDKRAFKLKLWNKIISNKDLRDVGYIPQNIYITSDEEIKDVRPHKGKWQLEQEQILNKFPTYLTDLSECKLVIMTTDPDLIAEGVQAITNTFAEWFVKNPSCEEVKVETFEVEDYVGFAGHTSYPTFHNEYKIILPQEEPKQIKCYCGHTITCDCEPKQEEPNKTHYLDELPNMDKKVLAKMWESAMPKLEPKQETLEEVAEIFKNDRVAHGNDITYDNGFVDAAAKWQAERSQIIVPPDATNIEVFAIKPDENGKLFAYIGYKISNGNFGFSTVPFTEPKPERMYSEEEVLKILHNYRNHFELYRNIQVLPNMFFSWFEQHKKK